MYAACFRAWRDETTVSVVLARFGMSRAELLLSLFLGDHYSVPFCKRLQVYYARYIFIYDGTHEVLQ